MKTHFKSDEIAHVWANKSAPCGTSPGAMSFNDEAFKSYGTEIARHITHKGRAGIIINDTLYSVTTSKHQSILRRAIPSSVPLFHIGDIRMGCSLRFDNPGKNLFEYAVEQAKDCAAKAEKARQKKDFWNGEQHKWLERAGFVSSFFGLRRKVDEKTVARLVKSAAIAERKAEKARIAREAKEREEQQAAYNAWLAGSNEGHFSASAFPVAFRVESETGFAEEAELVSTLGARVPLAEAKRAFRFALAHREMTWHRNGETCPVGMYQIDAINEHGIVAGCHRISWTEIERLAPVLTA